MNYERLSIASLKFGLVSLGLLVYWVFVFVAISVFGFKVFQENITQTFYLSIVGILALVCGALTMNVMLNLQRIADSAEGRNVDEQPGKVRSGRWRPILLVVSFPVVFSLLYLGDAATSYRKETYLVESGKRLLKDYAADLQSLANYPLKDRFPV